jgi:cardiolipin synthase
MYIGLSNDTLILVFQIIYIFTVLSIVVVVISENRNPIKTVAWIMAVIFLPVIGIIWYLIFGQDVTKKHVISKRIYSRLKKRPLDEIGTQEEFIIPEDYISFITLLKNIDHSPLLGGNDVKIFTNGQDKFDSLFADIANAKKHIHVEYYALLDDEIGKKFQEALIEKTRCSSTA